MVPTMVGVSVKMFYSAWTKKAFLQSFWKIGVNIWENTTGYDAGKYWEVLNILPPGYKQAPEAYLR